MIVSVQAIGFNRKNGTMLVQTDDGERLLYLVDDFLNKYEDKVLRKLLAPGQKIIMSLTEGEASANILDEVSFDPEDFQLVVITVDINHTVARVFPANHGTQAILDEAIPVHGPLAFAGKNTFLFPKTGVGMEIFIAPLVTEYEDYQPVRTNVTFIGEAPAGMSDDEALVKQNRELQDIFRELAIKPGNKTKYTQERLDEVAKYVDTQKGRAREIFGPLFGLVERDFDNFKKEVLNQTV